MYDLHCHSLLSDGCLLPSEIAMRYLALGYKVIAITDHVDYSNIDSVITAIMRFVKNWPKQSKIKILPGIELTHLPLAQFKPLTNYARKKGIKIIVAHGESPVEPVLKGTNKAALKAGIDILSHPGSITEEDIKLAKEKGIFLEITTRRGHNKTNLHVAKMALKLGAKLMLNTDSHHPKDIIPKNELIKNAAKTGLNKKDIQNIYKNVSVFLKKKGVRC
jgi:histidinol phosphatase-like PHP family hydrolase